MTIQDIYGVEQTSTKGFIAYRDGEIEEVLDAGVHVKFRTRSVDIVYVGGPRDHNVTSAFGATWKRGVGPGHADMVIIIDDKVARGAPEATSEENFVVLDSKKSAGAGDFLTRPKGRLDTGSRAHAKARVVAPAPSQESHELSSISPAQLNDRLARWVSDRVDDLPQGERRRLLEALDQQPAVDPRWLVLQVLMPEITGSGEALDEVMGPWHDSGQVAEMLGASVDYLEEAVQRRELLGIRFEDGQFYFPARQFERGGPLAGLADVLGVLGEASGDSEAWALWFAGDFRSRDGLLSLSSKWEALAAGHLADLLEQAGRDSRSWAS